MDESSHIALLSIFRDMPDPRIDRTREHNLHDILVITFCASLAGIDNFVSIEDYAKAHSDWFKTFLDLPNGIPSHDTFARVLAAIDPDEFEIRIQQWMLAVNGELAGKHIAIDGKTLRQSFDRASKKAAIHIINAYVYEDHAVFAQLKTDEKSNEITAVPKLLEMLKIKGATITLDAMHCQRETCKAIVERGGEYVITVKSNQPTLREDVEFALVDALERGEELSNFESVDKGHGRVETRTCRVLEDVAWLQSRHDWPGLGSVAMIERRREVLLPDSSRAVAQVASESCERAYVISSLTSPSAETIAKLIRGHWGVENRVHWQLDMGFGEDQCRVRLNNAAENLSRVRRVNLMLLKKETSCKLGIANKRRKCSYEREYLLKVLAVC